MSKFAQNAFFWFAEVPWLVAAGGFGWAVIRSGLLPAWVGHVAHCWSALWLLVPAVLRFDLPVSLVLIPILFGTTMVFAL